MLYNWYYNWLGPIYLNFQLDSEPYYPGGYEYYGIDDVTVWQGNGFNTGQYINAYDEWTWTPGVKIIDVSIPSFGFDGSKHFAINHGRWDLERVTTYEARYGFTDSRNEYQPFIVYIQSGTHPNLVAFLVDQPFRNAFNEDNFFDEVETHDFLWGVYPNQQWKNIKELLGMDFVSHVVSWSPGSSNIDTIWGNMPQQASSILGLYSSVWKDESGSYRRSRYNNGFDMLFGYSYVMNSKFYWGLGEMGMANWPGNRGLGMKGYYIWGYVPRVGDAYFITLHESLHVYHCHTETNIHVPPPYHEGWIMSGSNGDWEMHWNTYLNLDPATTNHVNDFDYFC